MIAKHLIQDYEGDQVIDLLDVAHAQRRYILYAAIQNGFYHSPPRIMQRPSTVEKDREYAIRIPMKGFEFNRYHLRILAANRDLHVKSQPPGFLSADHYDLAHQWHKDRFDEDDRELSDDTLDIYMNESSATSDRTIEFRDTAGKLAGACHIGREYNLEGLDIAHAFYFYYDTTQMDRRLGYAMLLTIMDALKKSGCDYFFPGVYSPTGAYAYKANLSPVIEKWTGRHWSPLPVQERSRQASLPPFRVALRSRLAL